MARSQPEMSHLMYAFLLSCGAKMFEVSEFCPVRILIVVG